MTLSNQLKNQHLLWRAAFGPMAENVKELDDVSPEALYEILEKKSSRRPDYLHTAKNAADGLVKGISDLGKMEKSTKDRRAERRRQSADDLKNLNLTWLNQMINSEAQLREKASLFWHGHFACRVINIYFQQQLLHEIRTHALGNFGNLLREVSKSPAMLLFLNNQQNKKQHPNENFAREVMELFTLGRGNYTENDVKEAARAFTGWGTNLKGEFVFRKNFHDSGQKTFLGKTGHFDGDDIINIILEQPATASFIVRKVYAFFVNDAINEKRIKPLTALFYQSNYNIQNLLKAIFTSDWFYEPGNIGVQIKSPVELLVGIRRFIPMDLEKPEIQLLVERALGQVLFYPPNVAGWPGGSNWIDSSALLIRLRLAQTLTNAQVMEIEPKDDDDVMMGREGLSARKKNVLSQNFVDWQAVTKVFDDVSRSALLDKVMGTVLQKMPAVPANILLRYINDQSRETFLQTSIVQLMSLPEYQLR